MNDEEFCLLDFFRCPSLSLVFKCGPAMFLPDTLTHSILPRINFLPSFLILPSPLCIVEPTRKAACSRTAPLKASTENTPMILLLYLSRVALRGFVKAAGGVV